MSVSAPTWEQRVNQSIHFPGRVSMFLFGLDGGPDKIGSFSRVLSSMAAVPTVMATVVHCIFHIYHLITKDLIAILDWCSDGPTPLKFFSKIATITNVWRSSGMMGRVRDMAAKLFGETIAEKFFSVLPGQPPKGRWGSIDNTEEILGNALPYIAAA